MSAEEFEHADVVLCPGGPMLVRGAESVQDADGHMHKVERPVVAVCRCLKSSRLPWCDGTHKVVQRVDA
jgi:CDGSH-type Zn-finger protein